MKNKTTKITIYEKDLIAINLICAKYRKTQPDVIQAIIKIMKDFKPELDDILIQMKGGKS